MTGTWSTDELARIGAATELEIAVRRPDGTLRRRLPIWVVCADGEVYVRTWYRRDTGWFGHVMVSRSAWIHVPGLEADVTVDDVGEGPAGLRAAVDDAYRAKYGAHGGMTTPEAVASTLRLRPAG